jgi:hypothetical protein
MCLASYDSRVQRRSALSQEPRRSSGDSIRRYAAIRVSIQRDLFTSCVRPRIPLCFTAM